MVCYEIKKMNIEYYKRDFLKCKNWFLKMFSVFIVNIKNNFIINNDYWDIIRK